MDIARFSEFELGILSELLVAAYSRNKEITRCNFNKWREFDRFVFENLSYMDQAGFISVVDKRPIGFMSWDSRLHPDSVEIGHNCIIDELQGQGLGTEQLRIGLKCIFINRPKKLVVKTGNSDFFIPAQKMYESVGFEKEEVREHNHPVVSEIIVYRLKL